MIYRNEITRVFLMLLLELPPARQSPSHIKLLEQFIAATNHCGSNDIELEMTKDLWMTIKELINACQSLNSRQIVKNVLEKLYGYDSITEEQHLILQQLAKKYKS